MNILCKYYLPCGRMGDVEGLFITSLEDLEQAIGKSVYFGEILGKHSEIIDESLSYDNIAILSDDQEKINWLLSCNDSALTISGYNPLDYFEEE